MRSEFKVQIKTSLRRLLHFIRHINKLVLAVISISVSFLILGWLIYQQREIILTYRWQFRLLPIVFSFIIFSLDLFWMAGVWGWILNRFGKVLGYGKHIRYYVIANISKRLPGTLWYVASRFQFYTVEGISAQVTTLASGLEAVLQNLAGILVVLLFSTQTLAQYHISPILLIVVFIFGLALIHPKVIQWILEKRKIEAKVFNYKHIIQGIFFYVIGWILGGIVLYAVINILYPISISLLPFCIMAWSLIGIIASILFFSPSNFGITEIGLSLVLSSIIPISIGVVIAILARVLLLLYEIIWAGIFILESKNAGKRLLTRKD